MAAAAWTKGALDITGKRSVWDDYLDVNQLSNRIELGEATIMDTLARNPRDDDPRSAIVQPAARIGQTRVAAVPMWTPEQAERYLELYAEREEAATTSRANLPVVSVAEAADRGLASTDELARLTGKAENSLRRWARDGIAFPREIAQAERTPPFQFGPPRVLRSIAAVCDWILANVRLEPGEAERLQQARDDAATSASVSPAT